MLALKGRKGYLLFPLLILLIGLLIPAVSISSSRADEPAGWYEQDSGTAASLNAIEAVDTLTAWAVGAEGTIIKTTDGGSSWLPQDSGTSLALADISAVNGNTAWAVGGDSATGAFIVLKTIDGGETWENIAEGTGYMLTEIEAVSAEIAWVAGFGVGASGGLEGIISKTMDGGDTWYLQPPGIAYGINDIEAIDTDTAWAVGGAGSIPGSVSDGVVLKTTDGGWTWTAQTDPFTQMGEKVTWMAVEAVDANNVLALGAYMYNAWPFSFSIGIYMKSSDGGATWYAPLAGQYGFFTGMDISAVDASTAWVVGLTSSSGNISRTSNGGVTWACPQTSDPVVDLYDVAAASPDVAWAIGAGGTILHTVNGGFTLPAPHIESISPTSGTAGTEPIQVTITGSGFGASQGPNSAVAFGSRFIYSTDSWSDTEIVFSLEPLIISSSPPGQYEVTVTTAGGTSNAAIFTLLGEGLQVDSISPNHGIQYTFIMDCSLAGAGFEPGAAVRLENGSGVIGALSANVISPNQIAFNISLFWAVPGTYDVVVANPDGSEARLVGGFTVNPVCGSGSGTALLMLGISLGLLSLAGSRRLLRRKK
jgi:photosystem II stability/assembly factor-like uncharacterized protein